jgi:hypothetical protein
METLLEGIEENRLDALYLFITDVLRDETFFRRFFANLVSVLPHNFSVHRIEVGHEFLKHVNNNTASNHRPRIAAAGAAAGGGGGGAAVAVVAGNNNNPRVNNNRGDLKDDHPRHPQRLLFQAMTDLESLRTMIISDGYVQRKDNGAICTRIFLQELPRARSLVNLDVHRLELANSEQVELLASACESLQDSLEDLRLTGLFVTGITETSKNNNTNKKSNSAPPSLTLDPVVETLIDMPHLKTLALSLYPGAHATAPDDYHFVSPQNLRELCQLSTLQDLTLRNLHLNDASCGAMSLACESNSFLTTLDLRQNSRITKTGHGSLLQALNRNFASWCTVLVDDVHFQGRFNVLIELNQADRGHVVQRLTQPKLCTFLEKLSDTPSAVWYFLQLHDTVRKPLGDYLLFQAQQEKKKKQRQQLALLQQQQQQQQAAAATAAKATATIAAAAAAAASAVLPEVEASASAGRQSENICRKRKAITIAA